MTDRTTLQDRINGRYAALSGQLQVAAKFVAENPVDLATRSLRSVAVTSGVSPATFSRLARALGYRDYEQMREDGRAAVERKLSPFSQRASSVRAEISGEDGHTALDRHGRACIANIEQMLGTTDAARLGHAVQAMQDAGTVLLVGSMGSSGLVDYFAYMSQWFKSNWQIAGRDGATLSGALSRLGAGDVVFALSKAPYARRTVAVVQAARAKGATTVVITDDRTSPILQFSDHAFVVPAESPHFFSSYAATLVLMETMITMLLVRTGPEAEEMIRASELQIERLGENWTR